MGDMALRAQGGPCMKALPGALVLGADSAIGLTLVRELGQHGVPVHAVMREGGIAGASRFCATAQRRPDGPLALWLPDLIARSGAGALFAVSETDLVELARLPARIGDCRILTPRAGPLGRTLDKSRTLAIAADAGLRVPRSWQPRAGDDFAARAAGEDYPLVAKWSNPPEILPLLEHAGLEWIKAEYLRTPADLLALIERYRPIGQWPLIQQYCRGVGVGQMLHMEAGVATLRFQHRRLHEWPPEGGVSTYCQAEPPDRHQAQMRLSEALLRALDWQGPAMVEYRHDPETGHYWLMEVNGRFWGSLPLAMHCGAHFAWEHYRHAVLGQDTVAPDPRHDLRARYMVPETKRLARLWLARRGIRDPFFKARPLADLLSYILGCFDPRMRYYVFMLSDPRPWARDLIQIARKVVRRGKR